MSEEKHFQKLYKYKGKHYPDISKDQVMRQVGLNVYSAKDRAKVTIVEKYLTKN
jgi:hypothetical protein